MRAAISLARSRNQLASYDEPKQKKVASERQLESVIRVARSREAKAKRPHRAPAIKSLQTDPRCCCQLMPAVHFTRSYRKVGKWNDAEDLTSDFGATSRQTTIPFYGYLPRASPRRERSRARSSGRDTFRFFRTTVHGGALTSERHRSVEPCEFSDRFPIRLNSLRARTGKFRRLSFPPRCKSAEGENINMPLRLLPLDETARE